MRRRAASKYGCALPEALEKIEADSSMASSAGIDMRFGTAVFRNTGDARIARAFVLLEVISLDAAENKI